MLSEEEEFKILEINLALEGRVYSGKKIFEDPLPRCYGCQVSEGLVVYEPGGKCRGKLIPLICDTYPDSFAVRCEKHVPGLIATGWKIYKI